MQRIAVVGTGYVGLVGGAGLADFGHRVVCVDLVEEKIRELRAGVIPFLSAGIMPIVVVIAVTSWMPAARLVRASYLSLKQKEFVEAARCCGAGNGRIIVRHILPNAMSPIIVAATLRVGAAIITEAGLSFLGMGVQPPTPTWGNMLRNAQSEMDYAPWTAIFPGLFIFLTVISFNYIGDGLRDALDPRHVD